MDKTSEQTKKCPKCREDILIGAKKCKHCGADLRNWFVRHKILTALLIIFAIGILGNAGNSTERKTNPSNPSIVSGDKKKEIQTEEKIIPIKITAINLVKAYEENEVKADKDYKDKSIEVTGKIKDIGVIFGKTYVTLSSGKEFSISDVQCFFEDKTQIDKVSELKKDANITFQGVVDGKSMNVAINKCELL